MLTYRRSRVKNAVCIVDAADRYELPVYLRFNDKNQALMCVYTLAYLERRCIDEAYYLNGSFYRFPLVDSVCVCVCV